MALTLKPTVTATVDDLHKAMQRSYLLHPNRSLQVWDRAESVFAQLQHVRAGLDINGKPVDIGHVADPGVSERGETVSELEREPAPPPVEGGVMHGDALLEATDPHEAMLQGSPHGDPGPRKVGLNPALVAPYGRPYSEIDPSRRDTQSPVTGRPYLGSGSDRDEDAGR